MKTVIIQLEELVCPMCATKIETALNKLDGTSEVKVSYNTSKAKLKMDEDKLDYKKLEDTINAVGYDVIKIK